MLDSTGRRDGISVPCANCDRPIHFTKYTPEYGHDGGELNVGSCITKDSGKIQKAALYLIDIKDGEIVSSEFHLQRSNEAYHYNGFRIPNFGFYPGEIMCLCPVCYGFTPSAIAIRRISHAIEGFVCRIMSEKDILISFEKKSPAKKKILDESEMLSKLLKKLFKINGYEKNVIFKINKTLKKLYSPH